MSVTVLERPRTFSVRQMYKPLPIKLSATRVKMYLQCPRQYRFRYVDEIPTVLTGALAFGKVIHEVLHNVQQWSLAYGEPLHQQVAWFEFSRLWDALVIAENPLFKTDKDLEEYQALARLILDAFVEAHREKQLPILLEYPFEIKLHDEHFDHDYVLRGVIDRVDQAEDGLVIVDYKTGKRKPSPKQLKEDLQLTIYAFAANRLFGQDVTKIIYYHLRDQTELQVEREESEITLLTQSTLPIVVNGIATEQYTPKPGYYCRFCDYRTLCQEEGGVDLRRYEPRSGDRPLAAASTDAAGVNTKGCDE